MRDLPDRLGPTLRQLRERRGLTQRQVADRAGLSSVQVSRWERGVYPPRLRSLVKLLAVLDARLEIRLNNDERETR